MDYVVVFNRPGPRATPSAEAIVVTVATAKDLAAWINSRVAEFQGSLPSPDRGAVHIASVTPVA